MHRKELNDRSPLRVLEQSIHGGLGRGNIGVVIARHGVGKTAFLVGVAMDDLLRERKVLHISLDRTMEKVCAYYDEIFMDLSHTQVLEDVWQAKRDMEQRRRIQCYTPGNFSIAKLRETLAFWKKQGDFTPAAVMIEGFEFESAGSDEMTALRELARENDVELWMSAVTTRDAERDDRGIPEPVAHLEPHIDVILHMAHDGQSVHIGLYKDHGNPVVSDLKLALDPTTLLLVKK